MECRKLPMILHFINCSILIIMFHVDNHFPQNKNLCFWYFGLNLLTAFVKQQFFEKKRNARGFIGNNSTSLLPAKFLG